MWGHCEQPIQQVGAIPSVGVIRIKVIHDGREFRFQNQIRRVIHRSTRISRTAVHPARWIVVLAFVLIVQLTHFHTFELADKKHLSKLLMRLVKYYFYALYS